MIKIKKKSKKTNKTKKTKTNDWTNLRLCFVAVIAILGFLVIVSHLAVIQFAEGKKWSEKAYYQQINDQILSPSRGTIYDSKGEILAQSIAVDTISLNPNQIKDANGNKIDNEIIAKGISEIFNVTYEKMMENLTSNKSVIVIEKKVEKAKVEKLKKWMSENKIAVGINIDEDSKRYYPCNNLASNLIGFCGTDNKGQVGLEQRMNRVLTGTAGKMVTATDVHKQAISDEYEQYIETENGSNIYLTIDANIQAIAEKYLAQAMFEHSTAEGGNVIIMNPQTGDILAMATYPDYDLNQPSNYKFAGYTEETWNEIEPSERSNILQNLWKNKAVSGTYEPGSTFKLITSSVGLEEQIVQTDTANNFNCVGHMEFPQKDAESVFIRCWRSEPHGSQTLREALQNSCNPAFMQLGTKIGASLLYKYFEAYGFFEPVGDDIAKAYKGTFTPLEKVGTIELATSSFGQRFEISPLQLITAVSAICNDGVLVKPKIVKQIENTDTKSIEVVETQKIRQVISKDTADKIKDMMQSVVTNGTGHRAAVEGYSIGGKSGTAEPRVGHEDDGYTASFIAISPIENTQVVTLVILYGLDYNAYHQGGETCGPVTAQIMKAILPYLGITSDSTAKTDEIPEEERGIAVPNVKDMTIAEAITTLQSRGFNVICNTAEDLNVALVADQVPKSGIALKQNSVVCIYTASENERIMVPIPNVKGMSEAQAENALRAVNLNVSVDGSGGVVMSQEPTYETEIEQGSIINIVVKEQITGNQ